MRVAVFKPKNTENVRPEYLPLIGEVFEWEFYGTHGGDEPYPGQSIWVATDPRFARKWAPDEDLVDVEGR